MAKAIPTSQWGRLSLDLAGPRHPEQCQCCGRGPVAGNELERWQEHTIHDAREPTIVVLCKACGAKLIEPHPRLYRKLDEFEPFPGTHDICVGCLHLDGVTCRVAKINGGPGIELTIPQPTQMHVQRAGPGGRGRRCSWETIWRGPVRDCTGRSVPPAAT